MAIEKMTLVSIEGQLKKVNRTLTRCCESECFHIVPYTNNSGEKNFSNQNFKILKVHNPYTPLVKRGRHIAETLGIEVAHIHYDGTEYLKTSDFSKHFSDIEKKLEILCDEKVHAQNMIKQYETMLSYVDRIMGLGSNLEDVFALKYIKVRFGRLPVDSYPKLEFFDDKTFIFRKFKTEGAYIWGLYFTTAEQSDDVDEVFKSLYFERTRFPDYIEGTPGEAKSFIGSLIDSEKTKLEFAEKGLADLKYEIIENFVKALSKLNTLNNGYELRRNVAVNSNKFYLSGYIPANKVKNFINLIEDIDTVQVQLLPHNHDAAENPPIKLKNNRFFRPFEMFVRMYGLPEYDRFDPTPFVAITYFLIYGIMFGDLGQGIIISIFGFFIYKRAKLPIGAIITRIGLSSAVFGIFYGSVFGSEEIIKPIFTHKSVYQKLGMPHSPEDIFEISSYLLIGALSIGITLIIFTILMNIISCIKLKDYGEAFLGTNGVVGLIFYVSIITGLVFLFIFKQNLFTIPYITGCIIIPLVILFFREPLSEHWTEYLKNSKLKRLNKNSTASVHSANSPISKVQGSHKAVRPNRRLLSNSLIPTNSSLSVENNIFNNEELKKIVECEFIKYQYGSIDIDGYENIMLYSEKDFVFLPIDSSTKCVHGIYFAPDEEFPAIDKLMTSLGFEKQKMPINIETIAENNENSESNQSTEFNQKPSTASFVIERSIDLFENVLTYATNTVSFLRIGGFILSHAGLMLVVNVLAGMAGETGSLAWIIVQIIGNLFVIGMEGFLVGIQALRLEFYEMFSRFYKSGGKPFEPI